MSKEMIEKKYLTQIIEILNNNQLKLFEINWIYENEVNILQILVENKNNVQICIDDLIPANEMISALLDGDQKLSFPYILEVASAGAERQVKTESVLKENIGKYFYLKLKNETHNILECNATLIDYDESMKAFNFLIIIKGRIKKIILKFTDIDYIRFAIKF